MYDADMKAKRLFK